MFNVAAVHNGALQASVTFRGALGGLEESRAKLFVSPWETACFVPLVPAHLSHVPERCQANKAYGRGSEKYRG